MRIVHVAPTPFGDGGIFGGGERYPLELSRALASVADCELISFGRRPGIYREPAGLRVRVFRAWSHLHHHPAHPIAWGMISALAGADLVHVHHMRALPSRLAALVARARGQPVVVTDHGLQGGDWGGFLPRLFHRFLLVSRYSAGELRAPPHRTRVIFGGADPARFHPWADDNRNGVLFVGRLTPHKGIDRLISSLPGGATLRVAGSGGHDPGSPEQDYPLLLRRMAEGRDVYFLGPVGDDDLPSLYRSAAVLALPSVHRTCYGRYVRVSELLSLAAIEAMASGTPVVASRVGGLPEVVQDGVTGFLVEPGDEEALRARLSEILSSPAMASRMGRSARELAVERFTWRACADRCVAAYEELRGPEIGRAAAWPRGGRGIGTRRE